MLSLCLTVWRYDRIQATRMMPASLWSLVSLLATDSILRSGAQRATCPSSITIRVLTIHVVTSDWRSISSNLPPSLAGSGTSLSVQNLNFRCSSSSLDSSTPQLVRHASGSSHHQMHTAACQSPVVGSSSVRSASCQPRECYHWLVSGRESDSQQYVHLLSFHSFPVQIVKEARDKRAMLALLVGRYWHCYAKFATALTVAQHQLASLMVA